MVIRETENDRSLRQRVESYLTQYSNRANSFVLAAEAAAAEADMNEYLLRRAEEELDEALNRVAEIRRQIKELHFSG